MANLFFSRFNWRLHPFDSWGVLSLKMSCATRKNPFAQFCYGLPGEPQRTQPSWLPCFACATGSLLFVVNRVSNFTTKSQRPLVPVDPAHRDGLAFAKAPAGLPQSASAEWAMLYLWHWILGRLSKNCFGKLQDQHVG